MKWLSILLIFFLPINNDCNLLDDVRSSFHQLQSENDLEKFSKMLNSDACENLEPYKAFSIMKKSEYVFLTKKMKYFKTGKTRLESYIKDNPNNIEAKYIRVQIQKNIPSFLNYNEHIKSDSLFIEANIISSSLPLDYQKLILKNIRK